MKSTPISVLIVTCLQATMTYLPATIFLCFAIYISMSVGQQLDYNGKWAYSNSRI